jgi:hypothetical protein
MEAKGVAKAAKDELAAVVAKRAQFHVHHVGTKLNEHELGELEAILVRRQQTQGEFIRGLILAELKRDREGVRASVELVEITAVRLLLINLLQPVATGGAMSAKTFDGYLEVVKKRKVASAQAILEEHAARG